MRQTLNLAWRGLLRNRRRSLVTLLAIAFGFSAIALFAGYTHNVYDGLAKQSIHGELIGHLTINKRGLRQDGKLDPVRYLFTAPELARIEEVLRAESGIELIAPRLALNGLLSNGRASTIFLAEGIEATAMNRLQQGLPGELSAATGRRQLNPQRSEQVGLSAGLAEMLHLRPGDSAAMLVNTLGGQANALDVVAGPTFNTGNAGSNDKYALLSLELARTLLDADGSADRLTLLLHDVAQTQPMRQHLLKRLNAAGFDVEIITWRELSDFYNQVHGMFDMIFGFIASIVLTVVVMSVANSMGMTVIERTREIGTLRAIGLKRQGVVRLFTTESALLTLIGCSLGLLITLAVRWGINLAHISYVPPNSVRPVPLLVDLDLPRIALAFTLMATVGTLAAYLPARRAARKEIIAALGHV